MTDKFFQLLRLSIGSSDVMPEIGRDEWGEVYEIAQRQSLVALLFDGVQKMGKCAGMDTGLLMTWMGKCLQTERQNQRVDVAVGKVSAWFRSRGFRACILKGQGNALMYPNPLHRTPGDIDIWVSGKPSEVIRLVHSIVPGEKATYHHIDFPAINGIPVEIHYRPGYMQNLLHNHRLQRFFRQNADGQFSHQVDIAGRAVAVPTCQFNVVYQLTHIYSHLFQEGIGLRQIIDYYFVVCNVRDLHPFLDIQHTLKRLGLWNFAGAVMYVQHVVLGLPEDRMIAPMDERRGRMLMDEILRGGNFGQYDGRHVFGKGALGHNLQRLCRDIRLSWAYPSEALSEPLFRAWHFCWRMTH